MTDSAGADEPRPSREAAGWGPIAFILALMDLHQDDISLWWSPPGRQAGSPPKGEKLGHAKRAYIMMGDGQRGCCGCGPICRAER